MTAKITQYSFDHFKRARGCGRVLGTPHRHNGPDRSTPPPKIPRPETELVPSYQISISLASGLVSHGLFLSYYFFLYYTSLAFSCPRIKTSAMATSTQTATLPVRQGMPAVEHELHELRQIRRPATSASLVANAVADGPSTRTSETVADQQQQQQQHTAPSTPASTSPTWLRLKIFGVAFSFFCAGVNDSTLGPLVPYMLTSFSIGTGEIAIL